MYLFFFYCDEFILRWTLLFTCSFYPEVGVDKMVVLAVVIHINSQFPVALGRQSSRTNGRTVFNFFLMILKNDAYIS